MLESRFPSIVSSSQSGSRSGSSTRKANAAAAALAIAQTPPGTSRFYYQHTSSTTSPEQEVALVGVCSPPPPTAAQAASAETELSQLKTILRQQQQRLSSPASARTPRRPDGVLTLSQHAVAGQNYAARPYHRIPPRPMWEPSFSNDKDVVELSDRLHRSEERIESRRREMEIQWSQRRQLFSGTGGSGSRLSTPVAQEPAAPLPATVAQMGDSILLQPKRTLSGSKGASDQQSVAAPGQPHPPLSGSTTSRPGSSGLSPSRRPGSGRHHPPTVVLPDEPEQQPAAAVDKIPDLAPDAPEDEIPFAPSFQVEHPDGTTESLESSQVQHQQQQQPQAPSSKPQSRDGSTARSNSDQHSLDVPALLRRRTSSVKVSHGTIAMLAMLDATPDISLPAPREVGFERTGDILSSKHILKQDLFESAFTRRDLVGVMSGAPYFRMVPKFHIGGVAQAHAHGIRTAVNELRKAHGSEGPIVWVNLREEPIVYLNGRSHIIRSSDDPLKPQIIPNISGPRIAKMEQKLKREIIEESIRNAGNICVHHESANGQVEEQWECVDAADLMTLDEVFTRLNEKGLHVAYRRHPITQGAAPLAQDYQTVLDLCEEFPAAPIIFNCQTGRGRSSMMMLVASMVRFYMMCSQDINADVTLLRIDGRASMYRSLQKLISLLPQGALHERRVAVLMELSDKIYSVADHINVALRSGSASSSQTDNSNAAVSARNDKWRMRLAQYAYLLMFSCYCEQKFWSKSTTASFPAWLDSFPELKVLVASITTQKHQPIAEERITTPVDLVAGDAEVMNVIRRRRGHVLCANMILRSAPKDVTNGPATSVPGVIALRQLAADVPLFTCGRVSNQGREDLLYNIRLGFPEARAITWVSVRAEPMIFINGVGYNLIDFKCLQSSTSGDDGASDQINTMHVSCERLEEIEDRLVNDVKNEAAQHDGYILVHRQVSIDTPAEATRIQVQSVSTPRAVMEQFAMDSGVQYARLPLPYSGPYLPSDFDALIQFFLTLFESEGTANNGSGHVVVINDADGSMRTTIALNIASIVKASRAVPRLRDIKSAAALHEILRSSADRNFSLSTSRCYFGMEEEETLPEFHNELQIASVTLQMVAAGSLLKVLDATMELGGAGSKWNILHAIDMAKSKVSPNDKNGPQVLVTVDLVRTYLLVMLTAAYVDECQSTESPSSPSRRNTVSISDGRSCISPRLDSGDVVKFSEWIESLTELRLTLERLEERPLHSIKYVDRRNLMAPTVHDRAVERRCGDVLTANFAMKADHFPGCQKKGLRPQVCGAPNFRKVPNTNVFGTAIPTIMGVYNILSVLGAYDGPLVQFGNDTNDEEMWLGYASQHIFTHAWDPSKMEQPLRGSVVWVNLREEPIIYVGDRPFVFRDMQTPYVNVELTGIESHKVEHVENALKADILREAAQYDGNFIVHDEGKPGELVGFWEVANENTVKTVRQVYDEAAASGCRVKFLRLPVTDEQSPELKDFDSLVEALLPEVFACRTADEPKSFVFNCQMGRGRTTTGMVVCSLLIGAMFPEYYAFLNDMYQPSVYGPNDSELSKGNYTCILQLKSVLTDGREAKHNLDLVLEACSRMQNLRTAIEGFVLQVSSPDVSEEARARAHHHGIHYLQRYFDLVAFASYLEECLDKMNGTLSRSFEAWMLDRPELKALHDSASLS